MRNGGILAAGLILMPLMSLPGAFAADSASPTTQQADSDQAALEQQFIRTMTNASFVGRFTIDGDNKPAKEEHYTIAGVTKLNGDLWLIRARIQFGSKDVTVPLILPVKWAGDTPMISVTDVTVPGIGTYNARVLIYNDHYAGTWSGSATHRGELFGEIKHTSTTQPSDK